MPRSHVAKYLRAHGPSLSSDLVRDFGEEGVRDDAVRKRIERAKASDGVRVLAGLRLPHGDSFLYLQGQYGSEAFWRALVSALDRCNSAYGLLVQAMVARGCALALDEVPIVSGSPVAMNRQLTADHVVEGLRATGLVELDEAAGVLTFCAEAPWRWTDGRGVAARRVAEDVLRGAVGAWAARLGFASPNQLDTGESGALPRFGQYAWHVAGPCYLHPLVGRGDDGAVPGFFVADVSVGAELTPGQVRPFVTKCERMRAQASQRPFLAMLVADWYTDEALALGRGRGLMLVTPHGLFGREAAEALRQLLNTLSNAAAVAATNPDEIADLFAKLSKVEGAASNLRGPLFELIAAHCLHRRDGSHIEWGVSVRDPKSGEPAEIDVLGSRPGQKVWAIECKGVEPGGRVGLDVVKDWLTRQVPRIKRWLDSRVESTVERAFEIWTTGTFDDDAVEYLATRKAATKKYELDWRDGEDVKALARAAGSKALRDTLREHYFEHPLKDKRPSNDERPEEGAEPSPPRSSEPALVPPTPFPFSTEDVLSTGGSTEGSAESSVDVGTGDGADEGEPRLPF
jgi:hypothetical protein